MSKLRNIAQTLEIFIKLREKYAGKKYCTRMINFRENANFVTALIFRPLIMRIE